MRVMLSIKPEFVEQIEDGHKRFEFRKILFKQHVTTVVVYATKPFGMVVGEFDIDDILDGSPQSIWRTTQSYAGVTKSFFDEYYQKKDRAIAIKIKNYTHYEIPLTLKEFDSRIKSAPQSFIYLQ